MRKEELIRLKEKLEMEKRNQSKYVLADGTGNLDDSHFTLEEIKKRNDEKEIVKNIEKLFEELIHHYSDLDIAYDSINLLMSYALFYKEYDYLKKESYPENFKPLYDYICLRISYFYCSEREKEYEEDPTDILVKYDKEYIMTLSSFKRTLVERGFDISLIHDFKEVEEFISNEEMLCAKLPINFSSTNSKTKKYVR